MKLVFFPIFFFIFLNLELSAQADDNPLDHLTEDDFKTGRYFEIIEEARIKNGETRKVQMVNVSAWRHLSEENLKNGDYLQIVVQSPNHQVDTVFAKVIATPDRGSSIKSRPHSSLPSRPVKRDSALPIGLCSPVCEITHEKCRKDQ